MVADEDDRFFSRWSRRKVQDRAGVAAPARAPVVAPAEPPVAPPQAPDAPEAVASQAEPPPPTLEDAQALTPASDFRRFVARDVSPDVRNAAVKKLFADPHFNVMDGLDIYIDDYTHPSPLSATDLASMVSARFLKLVEDPEEPTEKTDESAAHAAVPTATEDTRAPDAAAPEETPDDNADLQLQPDHAPGPQGPGPGAG